MSSPKSPPKSASPRSPENPEAAAAPHADDNIEADTDSDSAYSVGAVTDTESLRSSILDYKWENGRRYHSYGDGTYWGPNDDRQQEAEDLIYFGSSLMANFIKLPSETAHRMF
ncbi:hypothetical protein CEP54_015813 [Fusarium duplospermum]|uniref:Uncharacterized protein n=1 Tax=Fusarium duplospermum TaxID=1325734 RepID=A0A428NL17_9HYPO|nr:hypothetical protein CEP54_015813 [Fusarium duplospermum]